MLQIARNYEKQESYECWINCNGVKSAIIRFFSNLAMKSSKKNCKFCWKIYITSITSVISSCRGREFEVIGRLWENGRRRLRSRKSRTLQITGIEKRSEILEMPQKQLRNRRHRANSFQEKEQDSKNDISDLSLNSSIPKITKKLVQIINLFFKSKQILNPLKFAKNSRQGAKTWTIFD